jgi:hypothetical protein
MIKCKNCLRQIKIYNRFRKMKNEGLNVLGRLELYQYQTGIFENHFSMTLPDCPVKIIKIFKPIEKLLGRY